MDNEIKQADIDNLADIIWWIKGYYAGAMEESNSCPFTTDHSESLRKIRLTLMERQVKEEMEKEIVDNHIKILHNHDPLGYLSPCKICNKLSVYKGVCQQCGQKQSKEEPKPSYTSCCPDCGSAKWSDGFEDNIHICNDCGIGWFSDINYKIICDNCGRGRVGFDGFCRDCNWEQIKTKEDLNKIQVHNQP